MFKTRRVYARFKDNTSAAVLAEMESLSSKNKNIRYLFSVTDVFTKLLRLNLSRMEKLN